MIPAVLVAGTHSGVGKTTITIGLMAALRGRGLCVQPFKVGPDFIDPSHHTAVCGRPSVNLDTYMMGEDGVRRSFASALKGADVAVVEGVMGLYDGLDGTDLASTADVAKALGIPVVLVINVHGSSRSAGAMELGYTLFDPEVKIAGTILNRVGSERHLSMLKKVMKLPLVGAVPRRPGVQMKSRHLGLQMGFETNHDVDALAALMEEHSDLDAILDMGREATPVEVRADDEGPEGGGPEGREPEPGVRIGVAMDEAFCFYYHDNLEALRKGGARIIPFSPLMDDLPDVDGVYIGGGYPELHAQGLEAGRAREQIKKASQDGMPIYGECGGLMYLSEEVAPEDGAVGGMGGRSRRMVGALPAVTIMTERLQALGYVEAEGARENPFLPIGVRGRGHEFHYSRVEVGRDARFAYRLIRGKGIRDGMDGLVEHSTLGGYVHAHFSTCPPDLFIEGCRKYSKR